MSSRFLFNKRAFMWLHVLNANLGLNMSPSMLTSLKDEIIFFFERYAPNFFTSKDASLLVKILIRELCVPSFISSEKGSEFYNLVRGRCGQVFLIEYNKKNNCILSKEKELHLFVFVNDITSFIYDYFSQNIK